MKKILLTLTILTSILTSCKKAVNYSSEKLVGTWYVDVVLVLPNGELGVGVDSTISNITNIGDGEVRVENHPNTYGQFIFTNPYSFDITMIDNYINLESQSFNYGVISGDGTYLSNNKFILTANWIDLPFSDKYRFTFYK